jgi:nitroreductase
MRWPNRAGRRCDVRGISEDRRPVRDIPHHPVDAAAEADPVPNELIRKILEAGVCAPSGGNMQRWRFLVIRDPKVKETVGALYKRAWDEQVAPRYRAGEPAPGMSRERFLRLLDAAEHLAAHIHEAPVWIVPCLEGGTPSRTSGSSIYPAVQNMLLAARALGLGATLTTLYLNFEKEAEAALGLPPGVRRPHGPVWARPPYCAGRCRLRGSVGQTYGAAPSGRVVFLLISPSHPR